MMSPHSKTNRRSRRFSPRGLLALVMLSLPACDSDEPLGELGAIHAEYDGEWKYFSDVQQGVLASPDDPDRPGVSSLRICGTETAGRGLFDDSGLCFSLRFDTALLGAGPATFVIDGAVEVPLQSGFDPTFTPDDAHSPGVRAVWAQTACYGPIQQDDVLQEVTGTLDLLVNDATRFAGHLVLEVSGTSSGQCGTHKARADVEFNLPR